VAVVSRLLDAGMNPNMRFQCGAPRRSHQGIWPRAAGSGERLQLLRASYLRTDVQIVEATNDEYCRRPDMDEDIRRLGLGYELCAEPPRYGPVYGRLVQPPFAFPLHFAAANGDLDMIRVLLAAGAFLDVGGRGLCSHNDWDIRLMYDPFSDIDGCSIWTARWTPLHLALCMGQGEAFWALRAAGAAALEPEYRYHSVLQHAIQLGRRDIVQRLLDDVTSKTDANEMDGFGRSLFWIAYHAKDVVTMKRLAALGADVDADGMFCNHTPLMDACLFAKVDMVGELLQLGASTVTALTSPFYAPAFRDFDASGIVLAGFTPLDVCVWLVDAPPKDKLVDAGHWQRLPDNGDITPDELKSLGRQLVRLLLDAGADIGHSVILAAKEHRMQALDALMRHPEFERYLEVHGVGGILRAIADGKHCPRGGEAGSSVDPGVDAHSAELKASLQKHGLWKEGEHLDWEAAMRESLGD
jgi:ankyrin repeat protein